MSTTITAPQLALDGRTTSSPEPLVTPVNSRRLSFSLTRAGSRHSDRADRRLSTTSVGSGHSRHSSPGVLGSLPTPGLLASLAGAAHYTGNPKYSPQEALRASFSSKNVLLEDKRKQTVEDVLELFSAHPSLEIFDRSWHRNAVFEDPWTRCVGFQEYTAWWFSWSSLTVQSTMVEHHVLSSTHHPNRIVFDRTHQYTMRYIKRKKTIHSLVILEVDDEGKIIRMEDRWNGDELPRGWGAMWIRRLSGKFVPLFVRVPQRATPAAV